MGRMNVKKIPLILMSILIVAVAVTIIVPHVRAGSGNILPYTVQNTTVQASFSYPDNIKISDELPQNAFNVSVTFSVNFGNSSIRRVNVTEVDVYIVDTSVNLADFVNDRLAYTFLQYGSGSLWTSDDFTNPICTLTTPKGSETAFYDFKPITVGVNLPTNNPTQVRLVVEIYFRILNLTTVTNQPIVSEPSGKVSNVTLPYLYAAIYTGEGESPIITITPTGQQPNLTPYLFIIVICILAVAIGILIYARTKRTERKAEIQTETSPTTKKEG
jgi:hypothetical protein